MKKLSIILALMFSSVAQALTWQHASALGPVQVNTLMVMPAQHTLYVGTQKQGVFTHEGFGGQWHHLGLQQQVLVDLKVDAQNNQLYALTANALSRYVTSTSTWGVLYQGPNYVTGTPTNMQIYQGQIYAGGMLKGVYQFNVQERNWQPVGANSWPKGQASGALAIDALGDAFVGTSDLGVYEYVQNHWQAINQGLVAPLQEMVVSLQFDNAQHLFMATTRGVYQWNQNTWQFVGASTWPKGQNAFALAFDGQGDVFTLSNSGLFEYVVNNNAWQQMDTHALPSQVFHSLAYVDGRLLLGTGKGLFLVKM